MSKRPRERTEFGARLIRAREHAGLSQAALASKVGMAQSTLAEAEYTANGSAKTAQIALATGVDAGWLATGKGDFLLPAADAASPLRTGEELPHWTAGQATSTATLYPAPNAYSLVTALGQLLGSHDHLSRLSIAPLLQRLAEHPEEAENIARQVQKVLSTLGNATAAQSSGSRMPPDNSEPDRISRKT